MVFPRNKRINIIYSNANYQFLQVVEKRNQILATKEVHLDLRMKFDSKQNKGFKWFLRKTNTSILCIPMGTTYFSRYVAKGNQILTMNEVRPFLKTNFDSKQNERFKWFLSETNLSISFILMETTHFPRFVMKRNQIFTTNEFHPVLRMNFDP